MNRYANQSITGNVSITGNLSVTGTYPGGLPYTAFAAILSQTATDAPSAVILHNDFSINAFDFAYISTGQYQLFKTGAFPGGKTLILPKFSASFLNDYGVDLVHVSANEIQIYVNDSSGSPVDGVLSNFHVEIRAYP